MITDKIDNITHIPTEIREAHLKKDLRGTVCEECVAY